MAKKVDPLKAKQAKQKKIAIGGCVLLLALLGFQGPKTLKMLKGPQAIPSPAATAAPATPAGAPAAAGGTAAGEVPAAAPAPELSAVPDSDLSPGVEQGQLATFERFASKDPFAQQAEPVAKPPAPAADPKDDATDTTADPAEQAPPADAASGDAGAGAGDGTDEGFTTGGSAPEAAEIAEATSISVNGVAEDVAVDASFQKDEPTFVLVKVAKNGKSVEIGIAGGQYADGDETITLELGKKLTLQNTADGSRYEIELLTIQGRPVPKKQ